MRNVLDPFPIDRESCALHFPPKTVRAEYPAEYAINRKFRVLHHHREITIHLFQIEPLRLSRE